MMARTRQDLAGETIAPDERAVTAEFIAFLQSASISRYPTGPLLRFNQARHSGCVEGEFQVVNGLDSNLKVGAFSEPRSYPAWIRFASAASASDREKDVRGMSIKLLHVPGENLTPGETSQDFILNSHPVMMVPGTREFLELLRAVEGGTMGKARYFLTHPKAARIAFASREQPSSHLDIPYWSTTPYQFGAGRAVKYVVRPTTRVRAPRPNVTDTYLHDALRQRLSTDEASFDFYVQFQIDATRMPIEDASVEWKERESPYVRVARLRIPRQDIDVPGRDHACERMAFNPWHCLAEHRPLGNMNRARREIYEAMSRFRQSRQVKPAITS
jgi:hypothetical protein